MAVRREESAKTAQGNDCNGDRRQGHHDDATEREALGEAGGNVPHRPECDGATAGQQPARRRSSALTQADEHPGGAAHIHPQTGPAQGVGHSAEVTSAGGHSGSRRQHRVPGRRDEGTRVVGMQDQRLPVSDQLDPLPLSFQPKIGDNR
jgi:hypothetical protein